MIRKKNQRRKWAMQETEYEQSTSSTSSADPAIEDGQTTLSAKVETMAPKEQNHNRKMGIESKEKGIEERNGQCELGDRT